MATYTGIKRDTTFSIIVGGNTLVSLQKLLLSVVADKSQEELAIATEKIKAQQWDEDWYEHLAFLSAMIYQMETKAKELGLTVEEQIPDDADAADVLNNASQQGS